MSWSRLRSPTLIAAAICVVLCLKGSQVQSQPVSPDWTQHYRDSTISFGQIVNDNNGRKTFAVIGTGIITGLDENRAFIVTAKHVFEEPAKNWHPASIQVRFSWQQGSSVRSEFGTTLTLRDGAGKQLWKALSDGSDIAAIVFPPNFVSHQISGVGPLDYAVVDDIYDGAPVFIYGYPGFIGNDFLVRAITRSGVVAWTNPDDPSHNTFLVDANIFPGNSGGPVFKVPSGLARSGTFVVGSSVKFLGIVSATAVQQFSVRDATGTIIQSEAVPVVGLGALGVIVPAAKVMELIRSM